MKKIILGVFAGMMVLTISGLVGTKLLVAAPDNDNAREKGA